MIVDTRQLSNKSRGGRLTAKYDGPHPVDVHVGNRIRQRRIYLHMSQEKLGEKLKVSFQQVQKYETGRNRVSASRLYTLSKILDVQMSYFFEDVDDDSATLSGGGVSEDQLNSRDAIELTKAYYRIEDRVVRRRLIELMRAMADEYDARHPVEDSDD